MFLAYHRILLTSLSANPICELTESERNRTPQIPLPYVDQPPEKGERKHNYLELVEKLDHVDAFDGDLIRAMADKVMAYKTKALCSTLSARNGSVAIRGRIEKRTKAGLSVEASFYESKKKNADS
ncbi:hypothetical protein [Allobaculum sp. JKK-2023]|uniref:hypothetical protein n=1 Tax=Allobaculum sp. JKK-2023 TaxID=3108943 RepID=UPI002B05F631|nr:hypothetical protein [Allobaculum sp. JKK-2023]